MSHSTNRSSSHSASSHGASSHGASSHEDSPEATPQASFQTQSEARPIEVVCHRGASNRAPENTFAAIRLAVSEGADYVELDVNQSADGVHYVFHGPRLEGTTDGGGLFHQQSSEILDRLDAGGWFGESFAGEPIPRLDAILEYLSGKCKVFFDVKRAHLPTLLEMIDAADLTDDCFFWFGKDDDAHEFRTLTSKHALKVNVRTAEDVRCAHSELGASIVEVQPRHISRGIIDVCRELGIRLMVNYMGKDPAVFRELMRWPIDMINLDHMDLWQTIRTETDASITAATVQNAPQAGPPTRRVVLFLLDGCRPDSMQQAETPIIDHLLARAAYTWQAQTVMPSISLPCHTSLFYSLEPARHGIVENIWRRPPEPAQSLGEVVNAAGDEVAMFYTWEELRDLSAPGTLHISIQHRLSAEGLRAVGKSAAETISAQKPAFSFVYLEATDAQGHRYGWMSPEYLEAVTFSDRLMGEVIAQLQAGGDADETVFVVMADHGGHDFGHGTASPEDMTIPIIFAGPGVRENYPIARQVRIMDVAPTILALLGVDAPEHWQGNVIYEILAENSTISEVNSAASES